MPNRYPLEQRELATRMALDPLDEYGSAWAVGQTLGPKLGIGPETLRKWVLQAHVDAGQRSGPTSDELAEIRRLKKENAELREANDILKAASAFLVSENDAHDPLWLPCSTCASCMWSGAGTAQDRPGECYDVG